MWETILVVAIILLAVGGAAAYVIKAKKNGVKCIGCPSGSKCSSCGCGCGCESPQALEPVEGKKNEEEPS